MSNSIRGTIAQLSGKVKMNGNALDSVALSTLTRAGFAQKVGTVEKPAGQRGKPATIWEFPQNVTVNFTE